MKKAVIWCAVSSRAQASDDKGSLQIQEQDALAWCKQNDYSVVKLLSVPGYSRSTSDIFQMLDDLASEGIYAYHELRKLWKDQAFDVLVCWDTTRLGRGVSLTWVIRSVIDSGAEIYSIQDGWIRDQDAVVQSTITYFNSSIDVKNRIAKTKFGVLNNLRQGKPMSAAPIWSHVQIRDEMGRSLRYEVDETKRRYFEDCYTLLLEGVSYQKLEIALWERHGHGDNGKRYPNNKFYNLIHKPPFWGHLSYGIKNQYHLEPYVWEEGHSIPEGIEVVYNTHEGVYTGLQRENIIAEIIRRKGMRGGRRPGRTHKFSGLVRCGDCGHFLTLNKPRAKGRYLRCVSNNIPGRTCNDSNHMMESHVIEQVDELLRQMIDHNSPQVVLPTVEQPFDHHKAIEVEIAKIESQISRLIQIQSTSPEMTHELYQSEINNLAKQLQALQDQYQQLPHKQIILEESRDEAFAFISDRIDDLWNLENKNVNQLLHKLMGNFVFLAKNKRIAGIVLRE